VNGNGKPVSASTTGAGRHPHAHQASRQRHARARHVKHTPTQPPQHTLTTGLVAGGVEADLAALWVMSWVYESIPENRMPRIRWHMGAAGLESNSGACSARGPENPGKMTPSVVDGTEAKLRL